MGHRLRWLRAFYFLYYGLQGISIPFLPLWLANQGLDKDTIGLIVATAFLPKILSAPAVAHAADLSGKLRLLITLPLLGTALLFACYPWQHSPGWMFWTTLAVNLLLPAVQPVLDRIALASSRAGRPLYTTVRVWGSLGFAALTLAGGYLIDQTGPLTIIVMSVTLALACALCLRALDVGDAPQRPALSGPRWPLMQVLRQRPVVLCILAASLTQASNGFLYSYATLFWTEHGLSTSDIGLLWTVGVSAEVVFFFLALRILPVVGPERLIWISAAMTAVRWMGLALFIDLPVLLAFQLLQAFTLGGNNSAIMAYISRQVPAHCQTSAIALYTMLSGGILMFFSVNAARLVYPRVQWGGFAMMAVFALCAIPIVLWAARPTAAPGETP
ncbi:MFS transporter [Bordetella genomosp. 12]|uniref:MFS transporter n=1 Tax=Bordetella genomosp. 12 TaxID=463035 RepID=A0A261VLQ6_9BORD|nr:MFS transporter [Bordetella genomosp. 12]OZI75068.1 MFS transporter [Bordetella genomosp. 12]